MAVEPVFFGTMLFDVRGNLRRLAQPGLGHDLLVAPATVVAPQPTDPSQVERGGEDASAVAVDVLSGLGGQRHCSRAVVPRCTNGVGEFLAKEFHAADGPLRIGRIVVAIEVGNGMREHVLAPTLIMVDGAGLLARLHIAGGVGRQVAKSYQAVFREGIAAFFGTGALGHIHEVRPVVIDLGIDGR